MATTQITTYKLKPCMCSSYDGPHFHCRYGIISWEQYLNSIEPGDLICANQVDQVSKVLRPNWNDYWLGILDKVAERGTCDRGKSGAILVDEDQQIIATGYVGAPRGLPHCDEVGHLLRQVTYEDGTIHSHCVRTAHAERNAIVQAAKRGVSVKGATLYCTMEPCLSCATDIINAGIRKVIAKYEYHGAQLTREWFGKAQVELIVINRESIKY